MKPRTAAAQTQDSPSTRDLILDAAERRFAERGFAAVSVRTIAADAGLKNQASLYTHFRSKRALYEAVLARGLEPLMALVTASANAAAAPTSAARTADIPDAFLDGFIDYLIEHPHLPRLIQRAALDDSRYLRGAATRLLRPLWAQGLRVLAGAEGLWEPADLPHLAAGLYQLVFGYFANAKLFEVVLESDPLSAGAVARQRRFLKTAVAQLLSGRSKRRIARIPRIIPSNRRIA